MCVKSNQFFMKNYVDEQHRDKQVVRTQLSMQPGEFRKYDIGSEAKVTFCLKELRAITTFADSVAEPISAYFMDGGE